MRIAYLVHQYPPDQAAGTELYTHRVAKGMQSRGHEVSVLTVRHRRDLTYLGHADDVHEGIPVRRLFYHPELSPNPFLYEFYNPCLRPFVEAALAEWRPDVVHVTHLAYLTASALLAVRASGAPVAFTLTDYWLICPTIQLVRTGGECCLGPEEGVCQLCVSGDKYGAYFGRLPARLPASRPADLFPLRDEGSLTDLAEDDRWAWHRAISRRGPFLRQVCSQVDLALSPSRFLLDLMVRNGYPERLIRHFPHGIDPGEVRAESPRRRGSGEAFRFTYAGSVAPRKGVHALVQAMKRVRGNAVLDIYGGEQTDPDYYARVRQEAEGEERIRLRGAFSRQDVTRVYGEADALVMPSLWYENAPLVIREAFLNGIPVIAFDLGGAREALAEGGGLLVPPGSVGGLAEAMQSLVSDPGLAERLGASAPRVRTLADELDGLESIYAELAQSRVPA